MAKSYFRQRRILVKSAQFNLDNGNGTTVDEVLVNSGILPIRLVRVYALYNEACGTVAAGTFAVGIAAGGATLVAATNYVNSAAIGDVTEATIVKDGIPKNTTIWVRHTGVGATQAGTAAVCLEFVYDE